MLIPKHSNNLSSSFQHAFDYFIKPDLKNCIKTRSFFSEIPIHLIVLNHPKQYVFLKCLLVKLMTIVTVHQLQ